MDVHNHEGHWECVAKKHFGDLYGVCLVAERELARKAVTRSDQAIVEAVREVLRRIEEHKRADGTEAVSAAS